MLTLPQCQVIEDFYPLQVGSSYIILEIKWLQTLGDMTINWRDLRMTFYEGNRQVTLMGDLSLSKLLVSCKSLARILKHESTGSLLHFNSIEKITATSP